VPAVPESPPHSWSVFVSNLLSNKEQMLDGLCHLIWQVALAVAVILVAMTGLAYIVMHATPADEKIAVGAVTTMVITGANFVRRYWWKKRKRKRSPHGGVSQEPGDGGRAADGSGG
jgi:hypothetical protein